MKGIMVGDKGRKGYRACMSKGLACCTLELEVLSDA